MPFGKKKNIAQGKPDGRKNNKQSPENKKKFDENKFVKGDARLVGDANPNKKIDRRKENGKHLPSIGIETRFQKGNVPKNKLLRTMLREKGFDRETINAIFAELLTVNPKDLQEIKLDEDTSMLELIGISGVEAAMRTADFGRMEWLLGQIFGKQVQRTETVNYNMNASLDPKTSDEDFQIMRRVFDRADEPKKPTA